MTKKGVYLQKETMFVYSCPKKEKKS